MGQGHAALCLRVGHGSSRCRPRRPRRRSGDFVSFGAHGRVAGTGALPGGRRRLRGGSDFGGGNGLGVGAAERGRLGTWVGGGGFHES